MESFESDDTMFNIKEMQEKLDLQSAQNASTLDVALNNQKGNIAEMEAEKALNESEAESLLADILGASEVKTKPKTSTKKSKSVK